EASTASALKAIPADDNAWNSRLFAEALAGRERYATLRMNREEVRALYRPWREKGQVVGAVQIAYPLGELRSLLRGQDWTLLGLMFPALLLTGVGAAFLTDRALRPVRR